MLRPIVEEELAAAARSASVAFAVSFEDCERWLRTAGLDNVHALIEHGAPSAFVLRVAMGQFVQGKSLSMMGVAGVTVPPEVRAKGHSRTMMREALAGWRDEGFVLSTLYPSTQTLYRSVGYEQCGALFEHTVPRSEIAGRRSQSSAFELRSVTVDDPQVRALYASFAARSNGSLDRNQYIWNRIASHRGNKYEGLGCFRPGGALAAYAFMTQVREGDGDDVTLKVRDFAYDDEAGARAVLSLCDRYTTISQEVKFLGGPTLPLLSLLDQQKFDTHRIEYTMMRIVHVERALSERPYPMGVRAQIALSIEDDVLDANRGEYTLTVEDGVGSVKRGAHASTAPLAMHVRALAPLFMGWSTASSLAQLGALRGERAAIALADTVFSAPPPALSDFF